MPRPKRSLPTKQRTTAKSWWLQWSFRLLVPLFSIILLLLWLRPLSNQLEGTLSDWLHRYTSLTMVPMVDGTGHTTVSKLTIQPGEPVATLPIDYLLSVNYVENLSTFQPYLPRLLSDCESDLNLYYDLLLVIGLLYEVSLGSKSRWRSYLDHLPTQFSSALSFTTTDQSCLDWLSNVLLDRVTSKLSKTNKSIQWLISSGVLPSISPPHNVRWAFNIVGTRAMGIPDPFLRALVPIFDLLNHDSHQSHTRLDDIRLNPITNRVELLSLRLIPKDEEVFTYYSPLDPLRSVSQYGFLESHVPFVWPHWTIPDEVHHLHLECGDLFLYRNGTPSTSLVDCIQRSYGLDRFTAIRVLRDHIVALLPLYPDPDGQLCSAAAPMIRDMLIVVRSTLQAFLASQPE